MSAFDIPTVSAFAQDRQFCAAPQTHRGQEPEVIRSRPTRYTPTGNPRGRVSTLDAAALRDYREAGHSWAQVAEHFGCSKYHANALVNQKFGSTSFGAKRGPKPKEVDMAHVHQLLANGVSMRKAAEIVGLYRTVLWKRLKRGDK